jgi:hypothetical protein
VTTDVATGGSFDLQYGPIGDGGTFVHAMPALASFARQTSDGWAIDTPSTVAFVARNPDDGKVTAVTNVTASRPTKVLFASRPGSASVVAPFSDASGLEMLSLSTGQTAHLVAAAIAGASPLAGRITCSFRSSDESIVTVRAEGGPRVALTAFAAGDATVTANCSGVEGPLVEEGPGDDASTDDASDDAAATPPLDAASLDAPDPSDAEWLDASDGQVIP